MLMKTRLPIVLGVAALAFLPTESPACTRAVYLGPEGMTVTGRTMDWREDPLTNLYIFPRGTARRGANTDNTVFWTSKYGTLSAAGYDIGITDGMNEAGLVANLLFLPESVYERPGDTRPVMGLSIWTQYVLDNFATVDEAVAELSKEKFRIDAPTSRTVSSRACTWPSPTPRATAPSSSMSTAACRCTTAVSTR